VTIFIAASATQLFNNIRDAIARSAHRSLLEEIEQQIEDLEEEIVEQVEKNPKLESRLSLLETILGIGLQTAAIVISEVGSPERFESARQVAAYAGLAGSHRESGTSVRGTPRMSKVGNHGLRRAMYFPAMTALRFNSAGGASEIGSRGAGKGEDGRHWGRYAEAPAHLLRGAQIRSSLRRFAPSVGLIPIFSASNFN